MKIVIIGGTGHVGTYLIPRLVVLGHEIICVTRGQRQPYQPHASWSAVKSVTMDREAEEKAGTFANNIAAFKADVVIDMICFTLESAEHLVSGLKDKIQHFLSTGTIWVHGHSSVVPTTEDAPRHPFGDYGIQKAQIEAYLLKQARLHGFPATILHPGHIVGQGWPPLNPAGHFDPRVFEDLARGNTLKLPNFGLETVHHVHADDVAMSFVHAINHWGSSVGESFHIVSPAALTLRGYAEQVAAWFGRTAKLAYLPWDEWKKKATQVQAENTLDHIAHSPNYSIEKARRLIDYRPRYSSLQAVHESVQWLIKHKVIHI